MEELAKYQAREGIFTKLYVMSSAKTMAPAAWGQPTVSISLTSPQWRGVCWRSPFVPLPQSEIGLSTVQSRRQHAAAWGTLWLTSLCIAMKLST